MNDFTQKLIAILVIVPILVGIFRGTKEMGIAAGAIIVALFFANLDKFSRFKGTGTEAQLRTAVTEAYTAIAQLKELGLSLSSPIVNELAVSGRMLEPIDLKYKLERVTKIAETLKKLGASEKEIEEVCSAFYERVTNDHMRRVLHSLRSLNPEKQSLFEGLEEGEMDGWDKNRLEKFIKDNTLKKSEQTEEWIRDLEFFLKNRKLRREEQWRGVEKESATNRLQELAFAPMLDLTP
jgi:truncated hemoglobin YjbI